MEASKKIAAKVKREFPDHPLIAVGGVVIHRERALLIRRGNPPLEGQWSIPGGLLEPGETLAQGVSREIAEETGLEVEVRELIEIFERIDPGAQLAGDGSAHSASPQYHFVILDYLCEMRGGTAHAGGDALEFTWAREDELQRYDLTAAMVRVLQKAFAIRRSHKT